MKRGLSPNSKQHPGTSKDNIPIKQQRLSNGLNGEKSAEAGISPYFSSDCKNIDGAWESKNYSSVLAFLKKDKTFPKNFSIDDLQGDHEDQKDLRDFIETRMSFHECIKKGDLDEVKNVISQIEKSKFYLNPSNESALYVAIKHEKFDIFAYLESIGVKFKSKKEEQAELQLNKAQQYYLKFERDKRFPQKEKGYIDYLVSISHAKSTAPAQSKPLENIREYYEELDKIPEISIMLKVLQYGGCLKIIYDFEGKDITNIRLTNSKLLGCTMHKEGLIYIAAGKKLKHREVLGTLAHELGHMAMHIAYDNDCNPYSSNNNDDEIELENIIEDVKGRREQNFFVGAPSETLLDFSRDENNEHCEIIVRVLQILVQYPFVGRSWLKSYVKDLFQYYCDKVIPSFVKVTENSLYKKSADANKELNRIFIETNNTIDHEIYFENISDDLKNFLRLEMNVLLLKAENTLLTLLRVLQGLYGKKFEDFSGEYVLFKLEGLDIQKMYDVFSSEPAKVGIIEYSKDLDVKKIKKTVNAIEMLLAKRPNLKFIFITYKNEECIKKILEDCFKKGLAEWNDFDFSVNDLDNKSKEKILGRKVIFQGNEMELKEIIGEGEKFMSSHKIDIISKLCGKERVEIGSKVIGTSSLEGAYADVIQKIDLENFKKALNDSDDVFIIEGLIEEDKIVKLMSDLDISSEYTTIGHWEDYKNGSTAVKRIIFVHWDLTDDDFKKFCKDQDKWNKKETADKKIFWISLSKKRFRTEPEFILKQCYYPNFYLKRKFRGKIILKIKINDFKKNSEFILIGCKEADKKSLNNFRNSHVKILNIQEAEAEFQDLTERNKTVHLFRVEKGELIWKNSNGSIITIKKCLNQKICNQFLISEKDFIKEIFNKKIVLISDDPGMGKTTTITKLYEEPIDSYGNTLIDTHWLIRINLKDHSKAIRNIKSLDFDIKKVISFLCNVDPNLQNDFCCELLNFALDKQKNFEKPLLVVFDGFDELPDENSRKKIYSLLHFLKKDTKCKLWVTTRRHYKDELEKKLATLAMEFIPIKDEEMRKFIKKYISHRAALILSPGNSYLIFGQYEGVRKNTRMWNYTKCFIEKMKFIFKKDAAKFIGVPLQLCLMLEDAVGHFKDFAKNANCPPDFSFFGDEPNLVDIYEKFIDMKYSVYFRKKNLDEEFFKKCVKKFGEDYSKALAESLTLNNEFNKNFNEDDTVNMLSIGIIKRQNESLEFIHFTFREYFSAKVFIEYMRDERLKIQNFNLAEILVKNIFLLPDYQLMRNFINLHLEKINYEDLPKSLFKEMGDMVGLLWGRKPCLTGPEGTVFHVALEENNMNIYNFIFKSCEEVFTGEVYGQLLQIKNKRLQTLLHIAVSMEKEKEIDELVDIVEEKLKPQVGLELFELKDKNGTALKLAENRKNEKIVNKLTLAQARMVLKD